jgi:hypothetical protein
MALVGTGLTVALTGPPAWTFGSTCLAEELPHGIPRREVARPYRGELGQERAVASGPTCGRRSMSRRRTVKSGYRLCGLSRKDREVSPGRTLNSASRAVRQRRFVPAHRCRGASAMSFAGAQRSRAEAPSPGPCPGGSDNP